MKTASLLPETRRCAMIRLLSIVAFALNLGVVAPVAAATIFSNLGPGDSYNGGLGVSVNGPLVEESPDLDIGAPFIPLGTYTLGSIEAALAWMAGTNAGDIRLMTDSGGVPGTIIESFHVTDLPSLGSSNTALTIGVSTLHPLLSAGIQYWVTASADGDSALSFDANITGDVGFAERHGNDPWISSPDLGAVAFRVTGTPLISVPQPASIALLGTALVALFGGSMWHLFQSVARTSEFLRRG